MSQTRSDIKNMFADLKGLSPSKFSRLIDALWRDYLSLYAENKLAYPDLHLVDETDPAYDERYKYVRNNFTNSSDELVNSWSTANGFGNTVRADFAQVFGFFNYALSMYETVIGSFGKIHEGQSPDTWVETDLLLTIANGPDANNRSNALEIFKSGLAKWMNALVISKFLHGDEDPEDGTLQFDQTFQAFFEEDWNEFLFKNKTIAVCQNGPAGSGYVPPTLPSNVPLYGGFEIFGEQSITWI